MRFQHIFTWKVVV